ncbi:MAG: cytochrome c oxidase assembly protein [Anaerolineae bacterium]|nr:cytochrome c oxidase assembly protein [Anaerolineae bacterium]
MLTRFTLRTVLVLLLAISLSPLRVVFAHPGQPIAPHDLWSSWNINLFLILSLELTVILYVLGIQRLWRRAGIGRGITVRRGLAFVGAMLALIVALISPLDALSGALFSAHMAQHLILMLVAAPLLVLSEFPLALLWALPRTSAQTLGRAWNRAAMLHRVWQVMRHPLAAWALFAVTMWVWHLPALYEAALHDEALHAFEHLNFLLTAMLFWWVLLDSSRPRHIRYGMAIPYLFTTALHSGVLGALLTFTELPWYLFYAQSVLAWGLSPLQDQQLAGLIMWLPGGALFTLLTVLYFGAWLNVLEQRTAAR